MPSSSTNKVGHNNPPCPADLFQERLAQAEARVSSLGPVTEDNAQEYRDEIGLLVVLKGEVEGQHKVEKAPHLEAGRRVDAIYKPLVEAVESAQKKLKTVLQAFIIEREREARRIAEEKARALREAEEAARKAEEEPEDDPFLAATAPTVDVAAVAAEAKVAELQVSAASRVSSAAGGFNATSLRTKRSAKVTDWGKLAQHYLNSGELRACLQKLADADIRHAKGAAIEIPGVEIVEERVL